MKTSTNLITFLSLIISVSLMTAFSVFAQTNAAADSVSAPVVVAPAQPATQAITQTAAATTTAPAAVTPPQQGGILQMALPFVLMLTVMYFIMIRPQQKKLKEHSTLLGSLKNGDEVITNSGIIGTITGMSEKVVNLEISKNVQIKILKNQVNQVVKGTLPDLQA